jgi:hypothetical protein
MHIERVLVAALMMFGGNAANTAEERAHTPVAGSPERQAVCDAARPYVIKRYGIKRYAMSGKLPQPIVFKVSRMQVLGKYCSFEAIPLFKDGSYVSTEYMMDIVFELCLKREHGEWRVIYDLSRTDVPSDTELREIWSAFPKDFPVALIPEFWRKQFNRIK